MQRLSVLFCLVIAGLLASTADASTSRGLKVTLKEDTGQPVSTRLYGASYALVIGNDAYDNGWPRLAQAVNDARLVARKLESKGFDVTLKTNLAADELRKAFEEFFVIKGQDPESRLFVWFAGHGHTLDGEGFLLPTDAPRPEDRTGFKLRALHLRDFGSFMRLADSKHVFAVFDSCFAGTVFATSRGTPAPSAAITRATTLPVRQFLTAGDADQEVSDDGMFRDLFIRALAGEETADANADGFLTASELGLFMSDRVTNLTDMAQTPRFGKLRDKDFDRGDFVFALGPANPVMASPVVTSPAQEKTYRPRLAAITPPEKPEEPEDADFELTFWDSIQDSDDPQDFIEFINLFPRSPFAPMANRRLEALQEEQRLDDREDEDDEETRAITAFEERALFDRLRTQRNLVFRPCPDCPPFVAYCHDSITSRKGFRDRGVGIVAHPQYARPIARIVGRHGGLPKVMPPQLARQEMIEGGIDCAVVEADKVKERPPVSGAPERNRRERSAAPQIDAEEMVREIGRLLMVLEEWE